MHSTHYTVDSVQYTAYGVSYMCTILDTVLYLMDTGYIYTPYVIMHVRLILASFGCTSTLVRSSRGSSSLTFHTMVLLSC